MTNFNTIIDDIFPLADKTEYINALASYQLLINDDLGVERNSEYALGTVFSVIDRRVRSGRPLIITTNLPLKEIKNETIGDVKTSDTHLGLEDAEDEFPIITKLFRLIGKEVCVLTDLDGFTDDNSIINLFSGLPEATDIANDYGNGDLQSMIRDIKTKTDELIRTQKENMVTIFNQHPYWINRDPEAEEDKIIRRALVARLFTVSADELATWPDSHEWISLKKRITVLFDILENLGCFILRRGAVESYYAFSPNTTFNGKPSAAANEVSYWEEKSNEQIYAQFSDIVRSLQFAALDKTVDESFAVKKELLSELALILGILPQVSTEKELLSCIKQAKGSAESLFDYRIINDSKRLGVEVSLKSEIIDVDGFPFKAFVGDNVNILIDERIQSHLSEESQ